MLHLQWQQPCGLWPYPRPHPCLYLHPALCPNPGPWCWQLLWEAEVLQHLPELTRSPELPLPELPLAAVQTQSCLHGEVLGWSAKLLCHALPAAGLQLAGMRTTEF